MWRVPTQRILVLILAGLGWIGQASAGVFDDDEARRQIIDLRKQVQISLDTQARAQLELSSQNSGLNDELARLRGQVETLNHELELARKGQQDFYLDLDTRIRNLEARGAATPTPGGADSLTPGSSQGVVAPDPAQELKIYEAALALLRANKLKEAIGGFEGFLRDYPNAILAPNAQFWMANAWSAQGNCKKAIELHSQGLARWPGSNKAADTLLSLAGCQKELGLIPESRKTYETLVAKYPNTPAGEAARQRLGKK
jgi:tol-pal system protein YbgF